MEIHTKKKSLQNNNHLLSKVPNAHWIVTTQENNGWWMVNISKLMKN